MLDEGTPPVAEADGRHVSAEEAADASDPTVGDGSPQTAPHVLVDDEE